MDKYEIHHVAGEGTYGKVFKAVNTETGCIVAIKKFKHIDSSSSVKKIAFREIRILKMLKHTNIVSLLEVINENKNLYLVFEFVELTALEVIQQHPSGVDFFTAKTLIFQLLQALQHCHSLNIIHRDIKPENLLVSKHSVLKLCDFGFARIFNKGKPLTEYVSTRWYRAPELLTGGKSYGPPVDVWSIGCIAAELITGSPLFPGVDDADTLSKITKLCSNLPENLMKALMGTQHKESEKAKKSIQLTFDLKSKKWSFMHDFISACVEMKPELRPSVEDLISHALFDKGFLYEFERQFGRIQRITEKKPKSKLALTPTYSSLEPSSYMKIYERKKSPKIFESHKQSEETIRMRKPHASRYIERSYFLPDIKNKSELTRKKSSRYLKKQLEIKTEAKSTMKSSELEAKDFQHRNPSLSHEDSEYFSKLTQLSNLSNRNQLTPNGFLSILDQFPQNSFMHDRYRIRRYANIKSTNHTVSSSKNVSPKYRLLNK